LTPSGAATAPLKIKTLIPPAITLLKLWVSGVKPTSTAGSLEQQAQLPVAYQYFGEYISWRQE